MVKFIFFIGLALICAVLFSILRISSECSRREEEKFNIYEKIEKNMD